jgi:hypothetical protein
VDLQYHEPIEYKEIEHTRSTSKGREQLILVSSYPETIFDHDPFLQTFLERSCKKISLKRTLVHRTFCPTGRIEYHSAW